MKDGANRGRSNPGAVAFGDLLRVEVDLGIDAEAADDAGNGVPGHFDEFFVAEWPLREQFQLRRGES